MSQIPRPHEIYRHFKGNLYQVLAVAEHSETGEQLVIYQALYGQFKIYARPLADFTAKLDREKYPQASQTYRFELQPVQDVAAEPGDRDAQPAAAHGKGAQEPEEEREVSVDPMVLEFLDADTYEKRLEILMCLKPRITDEMITTMAVACDVEVPEGSIEERFNGLKSCLSMLDKYECSRLR